MDDEIKTVEEAEEKAEEKKEIKENTGISFAKKIGPIGIAFFLFLFVVFLVVCFMTGIEPVKDYEAPNTSEYYAQSEETLAELHAEIDENVLPNLDGVVGSEISDGKIVVTTTEQEFFKVRAAVLRYYDESLFEFVKE